MKIHRIDHVGVIVNDLPAAKAFFLNLGLELLGETEVEGEWGKRIYGLHDVRETIVWFGMPDGQAKLELIKFHTSLDEKGVKQPLQHIALAVENIEAIVDKLRDNGEEIFGEIETFENLYKLCYVRGPEGMIIELAEKMKD